MPQEEGERVVQGWDDWEVISRGGLPQRQKATRTGGEPTCDSSWYGTWEAKVYKVKRNTDGSLTENCSFKKLISKHMEWGLILRRR